MVIATKCGLVWHTEKGKEFFSEYGKPVNIYLHPDSIRYELEQSLRRLGTDYVDLYQTHFQDPTTPIEDTMATLLDLKKEGKIRAIGVSNISLTELEEYQRYGVVNCGQERFSMLDLGIQNTILPYCQKHGISMIAYSPICLGLLSGNMGPERTFEGDDYRRNNPRFSVQSRLYLAEMQSMYKHIAESRGLTLAQLAIAWTISQPGISYALLGARNRQQACENAFPSDIRLTDEEMTTINEAIKIHAHKIPPG